MKVSPVGYVIWSHIHQGLSWRVPSFPKTFASNFAVVTECVVVYVELYRDSEGLPSFEKILPKL